MRKLLLAGLVFTAACAPKVEVVPYIQQFPDPTENVDVYQSVQAVDREYKEIALITVDDGGWEKSEADLLTRALARARKIGADAVIVMGQEQRVDGAYVTPDQGYGQVAVASNRRIVRVTAIVYQ